MADSFSYIKVYHHDSQLGANQMPGFCQSRDAKFQEPNHNVRAFSGPLKPSTLSFIL